MFKWFCFAYLYTFPFTSLQEIISWRCFLDRNHINSAATSNSHQYQFQDLCSMIISPRTAIYTYYMPSFVLIQMEVVVTLFNVIFILLFLLIIQNLSQFTLIILSDNPQNISKTLCCNSQIAQLLELQLVDLVWFCIGKESDPQVT
jgi:hypothetical protein